MTTVCFLYRSDKKGKWAHNLADATEPQENSRVKKEGGNLLFSVQD